MISSILELAALALVVTGVAILFGAGVALVVAGIGLGLFGYALGDR